MPAAAGLYKNDKVTITVINLWRKPTRKRVRAVRKSDLLQKKFITDIIYFNRKTQEEGTNKI